MTQEQKETCIGLLETLLNTTRYAESFSLQMLENMDILQEAVRGKLADKFTGELTDKLTHAKEINCLIENMVKQQFRRQLGRMKSSAASLNELLRILNSL